MENGATKTRYQSATRLGIGSIMNTLLAGHFSIAHTQSPGIPPHATGCRTHPGRPKSYFP